MPSILHGSQASSTLRGQILHHLAQKENLRQLEAKLEGEGLQPGDRLG